MVVLSALNNRIPQRCQSSPGAARGRAGVSGPGGRCFQREGIEASPVISGERAPHPESPRLNVADVNRVAVDQDRFTVIEGLQECIAKAFVEAGIGNEVGGGIRIGQRVDPLAIVLFMALGIDPTGGADPLSPAVIWQAIYAYDTYTFVSTPAVLAQGPVMTLYLRGRSLWALRHNDFHFDQGTFAAQG